jgi:hypothetical protein
VDDVADRGEAPRVARCPICRSPTVPEARPFCSARCREIDLGRWLTGAYVIAGGGTDEDGEVGAGGVPPMGHGERDDPEG